MSAYRRDEDKKLKQDINWKDVEQILLEAKIIARWAKHPFYIS